MARFNASRWVAGLAGFALMGCAAKASSFKSITLCDFERTADPVAESPHVDIATALKKPNYVNHDFRWITSGYASMEPVTKDEAKAAKNKPFYKFFQGKIAAKVRFSVPSDYKKITADNKPKSWESGMTLSTDSYTPLKTTDWSGFKYLAMSVYNPGEKDQRLHVRYADSAANVTESSTVIPAGGPCTVEFNLDQLSDARINAHDMRALTLFLDTAEQSKDVYLVFDNIGIHTGTYEERKKADLEEESATEEEEDWDTEDEDTGKLVLGVVSRPSGITGLNSPAALSGSAGSASAVSGAAY
jgi:hypothetical protein